jgi:two-component system cell cycle response regulator
MPNPPPSSGFSNSLPPAPQPGAVLVTDDDAATRTLIARWLMGAGLLTMEASTGEQAIALAREHAETIDAIVLDVMMPGMDGYAVLEKLSSDPLTSNIPVLLVTAHANAEDDLVKSFQKGAVDHIPKPFRGSVLTAKVQSFCARRRAERQLASRLAVAEARATTDALTRLYNRRHFESRLPEEAANARRHKVPFSLLLADLDYFKSINDLFGHAEGDRVLVHVADSIRAVLRSEDTGYRVGGEEFAVLLRATDSTGGTAFGERLRRWLEQHPLDLGGESRVITFSAGVASADAAHDFSADRIVERADEALYRAKRGGRDRVELAE